MAGHETLTVSKFQADYTKQPTVVNVEDDKGICDSFTANSSIPFAFLFDPYQNTEEAMAGYSFTKISDLFHFPELPLVLWSRKSYHGSTPDSSVSENELLIIRHVKSRLVGRQELEVYSHTHQKKKTLYSTCVGSFSTKPQDTALYLSDILKHMPDILLHPRKVVMLDPVINPFTAPSVAPHLSDKPRIVMLSISTSRDNGEDTSHPPPCTHSPQFFPYILYCIIISCPHVLYIKEAKYTSASHTW